MSYMTTSERQSLLSAELATARTRSLFAQALGRVSTAFGLSHATLMHAPSPEDLLLKPLLIESSLPAAYVRDFDRAHMMRGCPFGVRLRAVCRAAGMAPQRRLQWSGLSPPNFVP